MKKLTFLFLLFPLFLVGQNYNFSRLDNTHGLSNNQIECIFKDSYGFMWFGTNYGLNRYDGYNIKTFKSVKNDTTSIMYNAITDISEDHNRNLWLRSNSGFVIYNSEKEIFIRNIYPYLQTFGVKFIPALVEIDGDKNIYFYQSGKGVFKYDVQQKKLIPFLQSTKPNSLSAGRIVSIKAKKGVFWVLHQSGLLERFNERTNTVDFRNAYVNSISSGSFIEKKLFVDADGCPWVYPGKADKGVVWYNFNTNEWSYFTDDVKQIKTPTDKLLVADFVRDIAQEKDGKIWIATDHGGVAVFDKKTNHISFIKNDPQNPNSLSQNSAISLFYDNTGIMWIGTYKNGVSYYHPGMFKFEKSPLYFYRNADVESKDCNSLYVDSKGLLWMGTNGSGLLCYNDKTNQFKHYKNRKNDPSSISSDIITSVTEDKKGVMWFGTFLGGLNRMNGEKFIRYQVNQNNPNSLSNNSVYGLISDAGDHLWIGTLGGGIDELSEDRQTFQHYTSEKFPDMSSNYILSMYSKDRNNIFVSTSEGIDVLNTQSKSVGQVFKDMNIRSKLSDMVIYNTLLDSSGLLWIATDNGINIYNSVEGTIHYLSMSNGLPSDQVVSLVEDNYHNIWAGTRNGLARISRTKDAASNELKYSVVTFDENDGLLSSIFNQNAIFKDRAGRIYVGCIKGYTVFDPSKIQFNKVAPTPRFCSLFIGKQEILPGRKYKNRYVLDESATRTKKIVLNYNDQNIIIRFSAMSYIHPEKNRYRYKLSGLDNDWIETRTGEAVYSNLNSGTYQLMVFASNNDNVWSSEPLLLEIVVRPPFWLTWWAISLYVLFAIFLIWYIINYNLRRQKKEFENEQRIREARQLHEVDEMKFRFFTNISHEFRTPLTLIINPTEKLLKENQDENQQKLLQIIQRNANGLLELVNQLLDFRKLDVKKDNLNLSVGDVVSFIREICHSFTELANKKTIEFAFSTALTELRMSFDAEKLRKIVYNLLSNAFKFTEENGKINVHLSIIVSADDKKQLKISVSDTGIGIPEKDIDHIFERFYRVENTKNTHQTGTGVGLHIVSEYVRMHEGRIKVESIEGKGSEFTILLPVSEFIQQEILSQKNAVNEKIADEIPENTMQEEVEKKKPLMLVVDDNQDFRDFISSIFASSYRILTAPDGEVALLLTLKHIPDLVICDVMMPKMDGYEYCRKVKSDIRISQIPIILLTAKTGDENKYKGLEAGAEDYISKPFNTEMLTLKVSQVIERQQKNREQFRRKIAIRPTEIEITSLDEKFVKKAVTLVEANMDNSEFLVEDLCREMGMSRVYFYKKILALTDKTPSEFIRFIRLKRAADLLGKSQLYVNEVAYKVGFNDPKYFRKYFKEEFGLSPNEYKKKFEK